MSERASTAGVPALPDPSPPPGSVEKTVPAALSELSGLQGLVRGLTRPSSPAEWRLDAFTGRFAEVSGDRAGAALTLVFRLVLEAQREGEPVAWIGSKENGFFPPDVAGLGVDLAALPVIRVARPLEAARVADMLLRSGAFALIVLDLGREARLPLRAQTRLVGLSKHHDSALVCVTEKEASESSIGSLVSLRAHAERTDRDRDRFHCRVRVLKDKRRGPGWRHQEVCHAPDGLC